MADEGPREPLKEENALLRRRVEELMQENADLKHRIGQLTSAPEILTELPRVCQTSRKLGQNVHKSRSRILGSARNG
jgi:hypothetical protein